MSASRSAARIARPLAQQPFASTSASASSSSRAASSSRTLSTSSTRSAPEVTAASSASAAPAAHLPRLAREDPNLYTALRPPPVSALAALAARLNLLPSSLDPETKNRRIQLVYEACTHPSFHDLVEKASKAGGLHVEGSGPGLVRKDGETPLDSLQYIAQRPDATASQATLATVGNSLLGMFASEFLHLRYPNLPTRVLKAATSAYVGPVSLRDVGEQIGIGGQGILRWNREARTPFKAPGARTESRGLLTKDVSANAMRALIAVVFQELGLAAARHFVSTHFLTRQVDLVSMLKFENPKTVLTATCKKYGREPPVSRLVAESGRLSINAIFVVGIWSGEAKLGEGTGSSIKMAEYRAAEDSLRRLYLTEVPLGEFDVPSTTMDGAFPAPSGQQVFTPTTFNVFKNGETYTPMPLGTCEVLEGGGKSRR